MERTRAFSGSPFEAQIGFSRAVRTGDRVVVGVQALFDRRRRVEVEAEAVVRG